jgi:hypothetical protein
MRFFYSCAGNPNLIALPAGVEFTADQQHMCDRMHTPALLLPVLGEASESSSPG